MSDRPIIVKWDGVDFAPLSQRWLAVCRKEYGDGEIITFVRHEERSSKTHAHLFAVIGEAWASLPEHLADEFPSPDALRYYLTIKAGWCTVRKYVLANVKDASALAADLNADPYSIAECNGKVVTAYRAKSIKTRGTDAPNKAQFQKIKEGIFDALAVLTGVDPASLSRQAEAA